jgi:hypothetical protein
MIKTIYTQYSQFPEISPINDKQQLQPPKKKKPVLLIAAGILLLSAVVFVVLGFVFLATRVWDPSWSPFRPSPEEVLSSSLENAKNVKELGYTTNFVVSLASKDEAGANINLEMSMDGNLSVDSGQTKINLKISSSFFPKPVSMILEAKNIGEKSYYNISSIDISEGLLKPEEIDLVNQLKNKWIEINESSIKSSAGDQQIAQKIKEVLTGSNIYSFKKQLADENVGGKDAYHYQLMVDNDELKSILSDIIDGALGQTESNDVSSGYIKSFITEGLERIGELDFDVWIGKKDLYIYKLSIEKAINIKQLDSLLGDADALFRMEVGYKDFNKPVFVEIPEDSFKLEDVMGPIMIMADFNDKKAKIQADMRQLSGAANAIFALNNANSYMNVSCKYKGASSLYDVKTICADIKTLAGKEPAVYRSKTKYCAYVLLPSMPCSSSSVCEPRPSSYFCVDSTMVNADSGPNFAGVNTSVNPTGKGYCNGKTFVCPAK